MTALGLLSGLDWLTSHSGLGVWCSSSVAFSMFLVSLATFLRNAEKWPFKKRQTLHAMRTTGRSSVEAPLFKKNLVAEAIQMP